MKTDTDNLTPQCSKCVLCSFREESAKSPLFLYASTPILRQIVASNLRDLQVSFQLQNDLFEINQGAELAIKGLLARLSDVERADIRATQAHGAAILGASSLEALGKRLDTAWFDEAVQNDAFTTFFQPIVDIRDSRVFAHECLIRLFSDRAYSGGQIIETAISRGRIHLFDSYARRLSIREAGRQSLPGTKVFINFMPSSIYDPALCMASTLEELAKTSIRARDIVFEVVESDHVHDVKQLRKICDYYRKQDFGFALDDVGTGANSLQMVCDLKPDYIKLDKSLVSGIADPMYKTAVHKLAEFADRFGLQVIAEGVETVETVRTLQTMGIHLMQGYHFGRPAAAMRSDHPVHYAAPFVPAPYQHPDDVSAVADGREA